jgi:hypothetical protein
MRAANSMQKGAQKLGSKLKRGKSSQKVEASLEGAGSDASTTLP